MSLSCPAPPTAGRATADEAPESSPGRLMGDDVPVTTTVRAKPDAAAVAAVDAARAALLEDVDAADVGEHLGTVVEGERLVTHQFACTARGYIGWAWSRPVRR